MWRCSAQSEGYAVLLYGCRRICASWRKSVALPTPPPPHYITMTRPYPSTHQGTFPANAPGGRFEPYLLIPPRSDAAAISPKKIVCAPRVCVWRERLQVSPARSRPERLVGWLRAPVFGRRADRVRVALLSCHPAGGGRRGSRKQLTRAARGAGRGEEVQGRQGGGTRAPASRR